jgi:hypothetical protein
MWRNLLLLALLSLLVGCDRLPTCRTPCDNPRYVRNYLCDCFDPDEKDHRPAQNGANQTISSACMCKYSDGSVGAWFTYRPDKYGTFNSIEVSASTCVDLTVCNTIPTETGGYQYTDLPAGKYLLKPQAWKQSTGSGTVWAAFGRLEQHTELAPQNLHLSPVALG